MKTIFLFFITIIGAAKLCAQQTDEKLCVPLDYLLYMPAEYKTDTVRKWPLLVFLHGSGESGNDLKKVKVHGPPKLIEEGRHFPFIVVSPQAPPREGWEPTLIYRLIQDLKERHRVDEDRIYLTGLSMGGFGTWATAIKYPSLFAAVVPICGGGEPADVWKMRNIPTWCFHGGKDDVVRPELSMVMIDSLKKYNPDALLTIYPEAGHDSWTETYANDSLYQWLLSKKRFRFQKGAMTDSQLKEYAGTYSEQGFDTLHLAAGPNKLVLRDRPSLNIHPAGSDRFFVSEGGGETEIKFFRKNNKVSGFALYVDKIRFFRKVQ